MSNNSFVIHWKEFPIESPLGEHLKATNVFFLPYLINMEEVEKMKQKDLVDLKEIHLLKGIILGYNEKQGNKNSEYSKTLFPRILSDLAEGFRITTETLILNISADIQKQHGSEAWFIALKNAIEIFPESSPLKYECCVALYSLLEENAFPDFNEGVKLLHQMAEEIHAEEIDLKLRKNIDLFKEEI